MPQNDPDVLQRNLNKILADLSDVPDSAENEATKATNNIEGQEQQAEYIKKNGMLHFVHLSAYEI